MQLFSQSTHYNDIYLNHSLSITDYGLILESTNISGIQISVPLLPNDKYNFRYSNIVPKYMYGLPIVGTMKVKPLRDLANKLLEIADQLESMTMEELLVIEKLKA